MHSPTLSCSTIIPTLGRSSLATAVESVLTQEGVPGGSEVIVVNDSGAPLPNAPWMEAPGVRIVESHRSERSRARNLGASVAAGAFLHFLDDDDFILPGALRTLLTAIQGRSHCRLAAGYRLVHDEGDNLPPVHPVVSGDYLALLLAGESLPWGSSLIDSTLFHAAGGFDPALTVREDYDLECRTALLGETICIPDEVASFRIGCGGSTNWQTTQQATRYVRSRILAKPGVYCRLAAALQEQPELAPKLGRAYWSAALFSGQQGRHRQALKLIRDGARLSVRHWRLQMRRGAVLAAVALPAAMAASDVQLLAAQIVER